MWFEFLVGLALGMVVLMTLSALYGVAQLQAKIDGLVDLLNEHERAGHVG